MRTFPELIKSMLDLNRDQMIAVLEQEARHAEGMARVFASLVARARRLSQKENLFKHEAEMSSRLAGVQRILRCLQLGTPANDETGEEKPLRELLTERLRTNHEWPPRPNDDE